MFGHRFPLGQLGVASCCSISKMHFSSLVVGVPSFLGESGRWDVGKALQNGLSGQETIPQLTNWAPHKTLLILLVILHGLERRFWTCVDPHFCGMQRRFKITRQSWPIMALSNIFLLKRKGIKPSALLWLPHLTLLRYGSLRSSPSLLDVVQHLTNATIPKGVSFRRIQTSAGPCFASFGKHFQKIKLWCMCSGFEHVVENRKALLSVKGHPISFLDPDIGLKGFGDEAGHRIKLSCNGWQVLGKRVLKEAL